MVHFGQGRIGVAGLPSPRLTTCFSCSGRQLIGIRQEADVDHVALDDVADRGQQRGDVFATSHPLAAARVEHGP